MLTPFAVVLAGAAENMDRDRYTQYDQYKGVMKVNFNLGANEI